MVMGTLPLPQDIPPFPSSTDSSSSSNSSGATATNSAATGGSTALKKGPWTASEDAILIDYVKKSGEGNWNAVQKNSGLSRCGKSCRLRWANHLRPNLKKGAFSPEEEGLILELHAKLGNKWARMAAQLPGRTDNEIKNYWNTRIKRKQRAGLPLYPPDIQQRHAPTHPSLTQRPANAIAAGPAPPPTASIFNCFKPQPPFPYLDPQRLSLSPATLIPATTQFKSFCDRDSRFEFSGLPFSCKAIEPLPMPVAPPLRIPTGSMSAPGFDDLLRNVIVAYDLDPLTGKLAFDFDVKPELPSSQSATAAAPTDTRYLFGGMAGIDCPVKLLASPAVLLPTALAEDSSGLLDAMLQEAQEITGSEADKRMELNARKGCDWTNGKDWAAAVHGGFDSHLEDSRSIGDVKIKKEAGTYEFHSVDDEFSTLLDFMPPSTAPSIPECYGVGTGELCNEPAELTAPEPAPFADDFGIEMQQLATSLVATNQIWSLNSCPWKNMPGIY